MTARRTARTTATQPTPRTARTTDAPTQAPTDGPTDAPPETHDAAAMVTEPVHRIPGRLLTSPVRVLLVGCGGGGSAFAAGLVHLHLALVVAGHPGLQVTLMDGDVISATNVVRSAFSRAEVGMPKATVLATRLNAWYGLAWDAIPAAFTRDTPIDADVVVSAVDTRRARRLLAERLRQSRATYWLDMGNTSDAGQFVLGMPRNWLNRDGPDDRLPWEGAPRRGRRSQAPRGATPPTAADAGGGTVLGGVLGVSVGRLPTLAELYPETCDAALDGADTLPSCSAIEALERQEPFVNTTIAHHALAMLARLFRHGQLTYHGGVVNLASGTCARLPVDPATWTAIRERGRPRKRRRAS